MVAAPKTTTEPTIESAPSDAEVVVRTTSPDGVGVPTHEVAVVMPCLNEELTLATCIDKAKRSLTDLGVDHEIVIADNGSTDRSREIAVEHGARVVPVSEKGYGAALRGGIAGARSTYVIMGDADDSYDFSTLAPFVESLRGGSDLVMGNRFAGGIDKGAMPFLHKYLGNPVLSFLGRLFFRAPVRDFHCGLRGFRRDAVLKMDLRTSGMEFASEMVMKASLMGMRVDEVPTTLSQDGRDRAPHLRTWRDGWRHLKFMLMYAPRWLFVLPGLVLLLAGLLAGGVLLTGPVKLGSITLDVHTMLVAMAGVLVGFQAIVFGVCTETFAEAEGFVPRTHRLARGASKLINVERAVILGAVLLLGGLALIGVAVGQWWSAGFGDLEYASTMRWVIPGVTLTALGVQSVLAGFFLAILTVRRR